MDPALGFATQPPAQPAQQCQRGEQGAAQVIAGGVAHRLQFGNLPVVLFRSRPQLGAVLFQTAELPLQAQAFLVQLLLVLKDLLILGPV